MNHTLPGLLRRGAPVLVTFEPGVSIRGVIVQPGIVAVKDGGLSDVYEIGDSDLDDLRPDQVALDLSDPTGRWMAAVWGTDRARER